MGLDRGELDIHDLGDLGVALIRAHKVQDLQLHRRQRIAEGQTRLQEVRIVGCLRPHFAHQLLMPFGAADALQFFQQRQHRAKLQ